MAGLGLGIDLYMTSRGGSGEEEVTFTVLNAAGTGFVSPFSVLDSDGNLFTIQPVVLDSDGNSFAF